MPFHIMDLIIHTIEDPLYERHAKHALMLTCKSFYDHFKGEIVQGSKEVFEEAWMNIFVSLMIKVNLKTQFTLNCTYFGNKTKSIHVTIFEHSVEIGISALRLSFTLGILTNASQYPNKLLEIAQQCTSVLMKEMLTSEGRFPSTIKFIGNTQEITLRDFLVATRQPAFQNGRQVDNTALIENLVKKEKGLILSSALLGLCRSYVRFVDSDDDDKNNFKKTYLLKKHLYENWKKRPTIGNIDIFLTQMTTREFLPSNSSVDEKSTVIDQTEQEYLCKELQNSSLSETCNVNGMTIGAFAAYIEGSVALNVHNMWHDYKQQVNPIRKLFGLNAQNGGRYMKTTEKIMVHGNKKRVVYLGKRGAKYVRIDGTYKNVKLLKK